MSTILFEKAVGLFEGDRSAAAVWFGKPQESLSGDSPREHARTDAGVAEVETLIGQMEHGIFP